MVQTASHFYYPSHGYSSFKPSKPGNAKGNNMTMFSQPRAFHFSRRVSKRVTSTRRKQNIYFAVSTSYASSTHSSRRSEAMATYSRKRSFAQFNLDSAPLLQTLPNVLTPSSKPASRKQPRLTQMTIDLGGNPQRSCKVCGMEYIPSNTEDAKLHATFHSASVGGVDVPRAFLERARLVRRCERRSRARNTPSGPPRKVNEARDLVFEVDRRDSRAAKNLVRKVLEVVETELGAVRIEIEQLWSQVASDNATVSRGTGIIPITTAPISGKFHHARPLPTLETDGGLSLPEYDKYKAYLYIQDSKCLGLCLAERIYEAHQVLPQTACIDSSSISTCEETSPAVVGISRIWVSREHRGAGIGRELLHTVRERCAGEQAIDKETMAFSQPTESGMKLAIAWFGKPHGWMVYTESLEAKATVKR